jgi:hypothetical protein
MPRRLALAVAMLMTFSIAPPLYAANDDDSLDDIQEKLGNEWMLVKNDQRRNIKTYAKLEDGKRFRSFKVDAVLDSSMDAGVRVMLDAENYTKWYWEVLEGKMLKTVSPTEYYIYLKHRAPFGLPNRDVILHAMIEPQKKGKNFIKMVVKAEPNYIPEKPPLVRMLAEDMILTYTPLANNKVHVEAEGYVDPGGRVPAWANNYIQRQAPYSILLGLLRMMSNDEYKHSRAPLPFPVNNYPE